MTKEKIAAFYDNFLPHLERDTRIANARHVMIFSTLDRLVARKQGQPPLSVLDLGCGVGVSSLYMAKRECLVTAVDLAPKLIEFAMANLSHPNIEYLCADIVELNLIHPAPDPISGVISKIKIISGFDIITMCDILEHIPLPRIPALMQTIKIHSHKDTIIYLNIPDGRFISYLMANHPQALQIVDNPLNIQDVLDYFHTAGFQALEIHSRNLETPAQYTEYIFVKNERLRDIYAEALSSQ